MKKRIKVGFDCDGVQFDFGLAYSTIMRELYGDKMPLIHDMDPRVTHWAWEKWYPATAEQLEKGWDKLKATENFWEYVPIIHPVLLKALISCIDMHGGIQVYHITAREESIGNTLERQTINALKKAGWTDPQVLVTFKKGPLAAALDLDFLVDDNTQNCLEVSIDSSNTKVYLLDKPANRFFQEDRFGIKRVYSLTDYANDILKFLV